MYRISVKRYVSLIFIFLLLLSGAEVSASDFTESDFYQNLFQEHGAVMLLIDPDDGGIVFANDAAAEFYGYPVPVLENMYINQINTLSPEETEAEYTAAAREDRNYFLFRHRLSSGEIRDVEVYSYPVNVGGEPLLFSVITDITERLAAQEELRLRQQLSFWIALAVAGIFLFTSIYFVFLDRQRKKAIASLHYWQHLMQYIIHHAPTAIAVHDKDLRYLFVSKRYQEEYRIDDPDIIGKHHYEVFPDLPEKWRQSHRRILAGAVESADDDVFYRQDGSVDYTRWQGRPWYQEDGSVGGLIIYTEVINERKKKELALQESERRFRLLVETSPDAIFLFNGRELSYANSAAADLLGVDSPDKLHGRDLGDLVHSDLLNKLKQAAAKVIDEHQKFGPAEYEYVRLDGSAVDVEITMAYISYEQEDGILAYVRDISVRKQKERETMLALQQQRQQQKLESIGTLASGVAHEINNPIMGIINYAQLIIDDEQTQGESLDFAREIIAESRRISVIVQDLLFFSRQEKQAHSPAELEDIVHRTIALISALIKKDQIKISVNLPEDLPPVKCRSQQIQQVVMNFLTNARDALNEKYPGFDEDKTIKVSAFLYNKDNRRWIRLTIEDHGNGIPDEVGERLFDPFFTTKSRDMGTGLGLPISYGIVKEHHGSITYETEIGKFTRFHMDLPVDNGWHLEK